MQIPYLTELISFLVPSFAVIFTWLHHARVQRGVLPGLRPLSGIQELNKRLRDMVESGRPIHIATGAGQPGAIGTTAATIASLLVTQRLAEAATRQGGNIVVSSGDIVANAAARGTVRHAYRQTGFAADYRGHEPQLVAHQTPIAYAAGVSRRYTFELMDAGVVVGDYGAESLLIGEEGAQRRLPQLAGATTLNALPGLLLSTDATLIGEELFAAEAYLSLMAAPKARLLTQDSLRRVVVLLVVVGILYQMLNSALGLGLPSL